MSELSTNAVRHARTGFELDIQVSGGVVEIRVFDADPRLPLIVGTDEGATGGRGIHIVSAVADEWGSGADVRDGVAGKTVWARLALGSGR